MPTISDETIGKLVTPVGATASTFETLLCDANGGPVLVLGYDGTNYHVLKCNASRQLEVVMSGKATDSDLLDGMDSTDFVAAAGDTMTGLLTLSGAPTADLHASTKKYVDDEIAGIGGTSILSRFKVYQSSDQTPTTGQNVKIAFDTEIEDVGADFDTTNHKWTPPSGTVIIHLNIRWDDIEQSAHWVGIYKNGALVAYNMTNFSTGGFDSGTVFTSYIGPANGTDYFEAYCHRDSSTAHINAGATASFMTGVCFG